ncbi:hypothetical protein RB597_003611 [Gaeumannomyces tritici]
MPPFTLRAREPGQLQARLDIQGAFEDLRALVSPAHTSEFTSTAPEDVRRTAIEVEQELAGRQLLRNTRRLDALLRGLDHYSGVVSTLCAGTDHLPWLWAPVKLVLKTSSSCIVAFESLIKVYAQIAEHLGRFEKLHRCFKDNPEFHPTFAAFYVGILAFHQLAYKFVTRRCWKERFATSWSRSQHRLNNILETLKRHGDIIDEVADARITEARNLRQELQSWKEVALHKLAQSEREQSECHLERITSWLGIDDLDQISLRDSLVEVGSQHPGTADWILRHQDVVSWLQPNAKNPFLLLQGGPGTGKSVLSARVMRSLQDSGRSIALSHFCSYSPSATARYDVMVKSLLLGCMKIDNDLATHIHDEHVTAKQASIKLLENLLETAAEIIGDNNVVHIILDGVDECLVETQRKIFRLIDRLVTNGTVCKVLASGRSSMVTLHAKLRKIALTMSLSEEKDCVGEAIRHFVTAALRNMHRKLSEMGLPDQSVPELASRIVAKADGMFLWARLILNYLDANFLYNKAEFTHAIEAIPQELSLFYAKILSDISELQSALLFDTANEVADRPVPNYVLDACGPLVERRKDSTIRFIHISVKEYLQRTDCAEAVRLSRQASLWDNGLSSLRCLRRAFEVFGPSTPELTRNIQVLRGVWAFLPYTRETWFSELREMAALPKEEWDPSFWGIAQQLSRVLVAPRPCHATGHAAASIPGLEAIRSLEGLWSEAAASLVAESKGEILAVEANDSNCFRRPQSIHDIHANYEWVIQQLISISHHPDINASELEHFRENLSRGAYACRFLLCDASTNKFGSISERAAHEATHAPTFPCLEPGCQYPLFTSGKSRRRHQSEVHESQRPRNVNRGLLMKQMRSISGWDRAKAKSAPRSPGDANRLPSQDIEADGPARKHRSSQPQPDHQVMVKLDEGSAIARQKALLQQQQQQGPPMQLGQIQSSHQASMDNMDIPLGVKKWHHLKTWTSQHDITSPGTAVALNRMQKAQFGSLGKQHLQQGPSETGLEELSNSRSIALPSNTSGSNDDELAAELALGALSDAYRGQSETTTGPPPFEKAVPRAPRQQRNQEQSQQPERQLSTLDPSTESSTQSRHEARTTTQLRQQWGENCRLQMRLAENNLKRRMAQEQQKQQKLLELEKLLPQNQKQAVWTSWVEAREEAQKPLQKHQQHERDQSPSRMMTHQTQDDGPIYRPEQIPSQAFSSAPQVIMRNQLAQVQQAPALEASTQAQTLDAQAQNKLPKPSEWEAEAQEARARAQRAVDKIKSIKTLETRAEDWLPNFWEWEAREAQAREAQAQAPARTQTLEAQAQNWAPRPSTWEARAQEDQERAQRAVDKIKFTKALEAQIQTTQQPLVQLPEWVEKYSPL